MTYVRFYHLAEMVLESAATQVADELLLAASTPGSISRAHLLPSEAGAAAIMPAAIDSLGMAGPYPLEYPLLGIV